MCNSVVQFEITAHKLNKRKYEKLRLHIAAICDDDDDRDDISEIN